VAGRISCPRRLQDPPCPRRRAQPRHHSERRRRRPVRHLHAPRLRILRRRSARLPSVASHRSRWAARRHLRPRMRQRSARATQARMARPDRTGSRTGSCKRRCCSCCHTRSRGRTRARRRRHPREGMPARASCVGHRRVDLGQQVFELIANPRNARSTQSSTDKRKTSVIFSFLASRFRLATTESQECDPLSEGRIGSFGPQNKRGRQGRFPAADELIQWL
jgi:hypothetical protein